jgi:hypothetical protein
MIVVLAMILTALASSRGGTRTPDPAVNSRLLYQLSYSGRIIKVRIAR